MIPFMLRITATSLVLAAMALIAAGCGRSAHSSAGNAQVLAFARAVNLRSTEVPELRVAGSNALIPPQGHSPACAPGKGASPILSRAFVARRWETFSYVVAMSSEVSAERYVSALGTPGGRSCFVPEVQSSPPPSVTRLSAMLPAGQRYVGVRAVTSPDGRSERLHIDTFLFAAGPTVSAWSRSAATRHPQGRLSGGCSHCSTAVLRHTGSSSQVSRDWTSGGALPGGGALLLSSHAGDPGRRWATQRL
jgi:hypothetical protein